MSVIKHLGIKKGTATWAVPIYDNTGEAGSAYSYIKVGGTTGYIPLCSTSDSRATAGRVKEHTGTIWAIATSGAPAYKKVTYSTPGTYTFTVPVGVTKLRVEVAGAGGSSGGGTPYWEGDESYPVKGGKGGNGAKINTSISVTPSTNITIVVGAGGSAPKSQNDGMDGGPSSIAGVVAGGGGKGYSSKKYKTQGQDGANAGNGLGGAGGAYGDDGGGGRAGSNGWVIIEYGQGVQ